MYRTPGMAGPEGLLPMNQRWIHWKSVDSHGEGLCFLRLLLLLAYAYRRGTRAYRGTMCVCHDILRAPLHP